MDEILKVAQLCIDNSGQLMIIWSGLVAGCSIISKFAPKSTHNCAFIKLIDFIALNAPRELK